MTTHLDLKGSPSEIGRRHGEALAAQIGTCIEIYRFAFGQSEEQIAERARAFKARIEDFAPHLAQEIESIAEGADQPSHWIYALNARSELMPVALAECTAVYLPQSGVMGQTWDWLDLLEELYVVLTIELDTGHKLVTVTEPGIVGKIGLSSAHVGVCLNFMNAPGKLDGVPIHIILRRLMECASVEEAMACAVSARRGQAGHVLVGSSANGGFSHEFLGQEASQFEIKNEPFAHTNHALRLAHDPGWLGDNSRKQIGDRFVYP